MNGIQWADTSGKPIQAHGGGMIKVLDDYYWFGENRNSNGSFYAVSSYRSRDLRNWEFRKDVLRSSSHAELSPANIERPKVVYNASTGKFVMWMHWENGADYGEARAAVATASTVDGDYTYQGSFRPLSAGDVMDHGKPGYMSRDCGLFVDDDQKAYFISASNENYDLNLYLLTPDYLKVDKLAAVLFKGGHREAPVLFKRNGTYFLLTSGATGWDPNQASYATSSSLTSGWSALKNVGDGNTFYSQSTYVLASSRQCRHRLSVPGRSLGRRLGRPRQRLDLHLAAAHVPLCHCHEHELEQYRQHRRGSWHRERRHAQLPIRQRQKRQSPRCARRFQCGRRVDHPKPCQQLATSQQWGLKYDGAGYFRLTNVSQQQSPGCARRVYRRRREAQTVEEHRRRQSRLAPD